MLEQTLRGARVRIFPVLHGRLEFAQAVRAELRAFRPEAVALELPTFFEGPLRRALKRLPLLSVIAFRDPEGTEVYFVVEPAEALVEAGRTALEEGWEIFPVDATAPDYPENTEPLPDAYLVSRLGYGRYVEEALQVDFPATEADHRRELFMARRIQTLAGRFRRVAVVCGLAHARRLAELLSREDLPEPLLRAKAEGLALFHLSAESSREVLSEPAFFQGCYEEARREDRLPLDRLDLQERLIEEAERALEREFRERLSPQARRVLRQFARNQALLSGRLTPDFYQLVVAARGAGGDDFAWHLWEVGTRYPYQTETPEIVPLDLRLEDLQRPHRRVRFLKRMRPLHLRRRLRPLKRRPEKRPGEFKKAWRGEIICSFPPEDLVIENFGREAMRRALRVVSEELRRVEPFTASLKDGPDLRETIRRWHEGRLYVVDAPVAPGRAGSVVVIFEEDEGPEEKYPWKLTWHGEHEEESDMAFYATPPGEVVIGPGISRCVYGGFMLTYPPMRVYDIWTDPFFEFARTKAERLLVAAIDYSLERFVVYVARRPPSALAKRFAARQGKRVIYLPLGSFSALYLRRLRTFHVLEGYHVRTYAHEYIGDRS
ncbi:hypothetical protein FVE67_08110 [Thermosulfurimonas marina]|uniref:Uncharacterized protein n=1 Tax=Thermosulfurimonas marina TaxID=2047767 RepID=A0A6H1WUC7_9BACT|nr:hypothetical protein [Thermosulfurimonas marina]QJA06754.1 hypothetical protein FVE67_08110 [Thermosulfurimonas marina]